jgi:hypothetical protein
MAAAPQRKVGWCALPLLGAMVAGIGYWFYRQPYLVGVLFTITGVLFWIERARERRFRRRVAASRHGDDICDFARSFKRGTDTWILRATYDEFCRFISVDNRPIPVRREDRCEEDLRIDPDDLDDLARDIASRARRSMGDCDQNPLYGKVKTVGDLVAFLTSQSRIAEQRLEGTPSEHPCSN